MTRASLTCWFISLDNCCDQHLLPDEKQLLACLSPLEYKKYLGYKHKAAQRTNLLSRGMLRHVLSHHGSLSPQEWLFAKGEHGKPCLIESQFASESLVFNVSHSGNWLCIAVLSGASANAGLGVDIERVRPKVATDKMFKRFFAPEEIQQLQAMDSAQRQERFFDLWALKESYIKATGQGLTCSLSSFAFDVGSLPVILPTLPKILHCDSYLTTADEFVAVALSGEFTKDYCSVFTRLTTEYRLALTLPKIYLRLPVLCRIW